MYTLQPGFGTLQLSFAMALMLCPDQGDLAELMMKRGLSLDHTMLGRWVQRSAPQLNPGAGRTEADRHFLAGGGNGGSRRRSLDAPVHGSLPRQALRNNGLDLFRSWTAHAACPEAFSHSVEAKRPEFTGHAVAASA